MVALTTSAPTVNVYERGAVSAESGVHLGSDVWLLKAAGVPTGGDGWAGPGSIVIDITNFDIYMNTNTKASPTWTKKVD